LLDPIVLPDGSFQLGVRLAGFKSDMAAMAKEDSDHDHDEHHGGEEDHAKEDHSEGHHGEEGHDENHHNDSHAHDEDAADMKHSDMTDSDSMAHSMMMPALSVVTPSGDTLSPMMVHGDLMEVMTFPIGMIETGIYRVSIMLGDDMLELPVGVYSSSSDMTDAHLVLAPNPSLSSRGQSQTFLYAFRDGEPIHNGTMLQRSMAGMQHMTDSEELSFAHTHFSDLYDDAVGEKPMSNEMTLSFAMAGTWDVNVTLMGEMAETLSFNVDVLNE